jgi:putative transposase
MSLPRRVEPGRTHTVTRRCAQRRFFTRPDDQVNARILYALGVAMNRHQVELHGFMGESNHQHSAVTDDLAELSDFYRDFHSLTARALNAHYGRGESFWAPGSFGNVEVHDQATLKEQLLYLWTQPVKDGLVERPDDWPGVKFLPEDFGRKITVQKPEGSFFGGRLPPDWEPTYGPAREAARRERRRAEREARRWQLTRPGARPPKERAPQPGRRNRSRLPETVTFEVSAPPGYEHLSLAEVRVHFRKLLDARVADIMKERRAQGLVKVRGAKAARAQDPFASAGDAFPTFGRNPRIACVDNERRPALLAQLVAWRIAYRVAYGLWRANQRDIKFPHGTYGMRRFHGAPVEESTDLSE